MQRIEAPPPLIHAHSMPAGLPSSSAYEGDASAGVGGVKTPKRRGMFR